MLRASETDGMFTKNGLGEYSNAVQMIHTTEFLADTAARQKNPERLAFLVEANANLPPNFANTSQVIKTVINKPDCLLRRALIKTIRVQE